MSDEEKGYQNLAGDPETRRRRVPGRQPTVLLVWEGRDLKDVYADTEAGRAAAERLRASVQAEYDEWASEEGREPREHHWIEVTQVRVKTGEEAADE